MIIQKAGIIKFLRYLGIFCALTMGFFSIVATSEDDVEDALAQDADLTVGPLTVEKAGDADVSECEFAVSINDALDDAGIDTSDISDIDLNKLQARYKNSSWLPDTEAFTCSVTLTEDAGGGNDLTVGPVTIEERGDTYSDWITITPEDISVINYYLANRNAMFDICVVCSDNAGLIDQFSVTVEVNFDVEVTPNL